MLVKPPFACAKWCWTWVASISRMSTKLHWVLDLSILLSILRTDEWMYFLYIIGWKKVLLVLQPSCPSYSLIFHCSENWFSNVLNNIIFLLLKIMIFNFKKSATYGKHIDGWVFYVHTMSMIYKLYFQLLAICHLLVNRLITFMQNMAMWQDFFYLLRNHNVLKMHIWMLTKPQCLPSDVVIYTEVMGKLDPNFLL